MRVLESVGWGGPALSLLAQARELDPDTPAVLYLRHTARPAYSPEGSDQLSSTKEGLAAAVEFGSALPAGRRVRVFSTRVLRARETADAIRAGVLGAGGSAESAGIFSFRMSHDPEATERYTQSVMKEAGDEREGAIRLTNRWCAGLTPPGSLRPSGEFALLVADYTCQNLKAAAPGGLDVYVCHDTWVGCLMFHWFGVPLHADGVGFLDGFLMQPRGDRAEVRFRGCALSVSLPWWWGKPVG